MRYEDHSDQLPAAKVAENIIPTDETSLQIEELEPRVAPDACWGT
jgi:hypothetical protein